MKKTAKSDIAELINKLQEQLAAMDRKIDILMNRAVPGQAETRPSAKPFQQHQGHNQGQGRQENNFRQRVLHKAICADCKKECEVPFKPSGERPVYCKECFSKRKSGNSFNGNRGNRPREIVHAQPVHASKAAAVEKRPAEKKKVLQKKKPAAKKKKSS